MLYNLFGVTTNKLRILGDKDSYVFSHLSPWVNIIIDSFPRNLLHFLWKKYVAAIIMI